MQHRGFARLPLPRSAPSRQEAHGSEVARSEREGVQKLQGRDEREPGERTGEAPAQDAGDAPEHHQSERPEPGEQPPALPEEQDFGEDSFRPKPADRRVRETHRAPVERSETIINLVARLQSRRGKDKNLELRSPATARMPAIRAAPSTGRMVGI